MSFLTILCALLFEQFKPLRADNRLLDWLGRMARRLEKWCNAGQYRHAQLAWLLVMVVLLIPVLSIGWFLGALHPLCELAWNILVVYLTLGFKRGSQHFRGIQIALMSGEDAVAQTKLSEWIDVDAREMGTSEITRLTMEKALLASHRHVFGILFWFLFLPGAVGAVMYRVSEYLVRAWNEPEHMQGEAFGQFANRVFYWIEWLPARVTASAFAIVGNFEDAVYTWRNFANRWKDEATGIILAAGGGALGARLGSADGRVFDLAPVLGSDEAPHEMVSENMPGEAPVPSMLQNLVGLIWRTLLLWMVVLFLLSVAV